MNITLSDDGTEYIIRIPREKFESLGGRPVFNRRTLSRRQRQVIVMLSDGLHNKEIAQRLGIEVRTVKFHVSALLEKFDVKGRTELVYLLWKEGKNETETSVVHPTDVVPGIRTYF